jgi:hypothetical protein
MLKANVLSLSNILELGEGVAVDKSIVISLFMEFLQAIHIDHMLFLY